MKRHLLQRRCSIVLTAVVVTSLIQGCRKETRLPTPSAPPPETVAALSSAMAKCAQDYSYALRELVKQVGPPLAPMLANYLDDPDFEVRYAATGAIVTISTMYHVGSEPFIVKPLLKALGDTAHAVRERAWVGLMDADGSAFDNEDRRYLTKVLSTNPSEEACLVVGAVNIPDARDRLEELSRSDKKELAWAAKKALARMGVGSYAEEIAGMFRDCPDWKLKMGRLLSALVYVNQPPCILAVGDMLNSNPTQGWQQPTSDVIIGPDASFAAYAMQRMGVPGFPAGHYSAEELDQCRKWWAENRHRFVTSPTNNEPAK